MSELHNNPQMEIKLVRTLLSTVCTCLTILPTYFPVYFPVITKIAALVETLNSHTLTQTQTPHRIMNGHTPAPLSDGTVQDGASWRLTVSSRFQVSGGTRPKLYSGHYNSLVTESSFAYIESIGCLVSLPLWFAPLGPQPGTRSARRDGWCWAADAAGRLVHSLPSRDATNLKW